MPVLTRAVPDDAVGRARQPRDDVVVEVADGADRFRAATGPVRQVRAHARTRTPTAASSEQIDYRLAPDGVAVPVRRALPQGPPVAPGLARGGRRRRPPDRHAATALGSLCALAVVFSYIGTLLSQTITFAADEFEATKTQQGATLAAVRIGILGALALTALADRRGRRRVLLVCATARRA